MAIGEPRFENVFAMPAGASTFFCYFAADIIRACTFRHAVKRILSGCIHSGSCILFLSHRLLFKTMLLHFIAYFTLLFNHRFCAIPITSLSLPLSCIWSIARTNEQTKFLSLLHLSDGSWILLLVRIIFYFIFLSFGLLSDDHKRNMACVNSSVFVFCSQKFCVICIHCMHADESDINV